MKGKPFGSTLLFYLYYFSRTLLKDNIFYDFFYSLPQKQKTKSLPGEKLFVLMKKKIKKLFFLLFQCMQIFIHQSYN